MDPGNGAKRARSESVEQSTTPATVPASAAATPPRDPILEEQMERLGVDPDFKASLRSMSPNTRAEVMNDIIRSQRPDPMQQMLFSLGALPTFANAALFPHAMPLNDDDDDDDDDDENENDVEDDESAQANASEPNSQNGGVTHRGGVAAHATREMLLRDVLLSLISISDRGGYGGFATPLFAELNEIRAQRSLGITQDIDDMSYEQLLDLQDRIGFVSKGITAEQMTRCMCDVARPKEGNCVVCQVEWAESEAEDKCVKLNTCKHVFHKSCIEGWLNSNKTCPVCKQEVI